ncbi:GNAT family N-acetyltransferase [Streptomyces sp. 21So2-11]|uniref:GNAT family N-acetyltransferase n=1 Tax=Streptomyces sp. 21So2-11 TaxID=3144408 RepID=UPI003218E87E
MTELLHTAHTSELDPAVRQEIRAFLDAAFDNDFSDDDWDHTLGGVHAWVRDTRGIAAHGSVIQRRVLHRGRSLRVGYVEAVAVRSDRRRQGLGGRVMDALERVIGTAYRVGALSASDEGAALYAARGWQVWPGAIAALGPDGVVALPEEEGTTYLWPGTSGLPAVSDALVFDWREGDVL